MVKTNKKSKKNIFGQELIFNLYGCDLKVMQSKEKLREFCLKICELIKINPVGKTIIRKTGKGDLKGYSTCQFLETSSILIHTCNPILETYINIFSCRLFKNKEATEFTKKFFKPQKIEKLSIYR